MINAEKKIEKKLPSKMKLDNLDHPLKFIFKEREIWTVIMFYDGSIGIFGFGYFRSVFRFLRRKPLVFRFRCTSWFADFF